MIDKKLELNKSIKECLPVALEYFIKFYGEEYRDIIEDKFANCTYIGYVFPEDMKRYLNEIYQDKLLELYNYFLEENGFEISQSNFRKYFGYNNNFLKEPKDSRLSILLEYIYNELDNVYIRNELLQLLRQISENKDIIYGSEEFYRVIEEIKMLKYSFDKIAQEFDEYKLKYVKYDSYVDSCYDLKKKIGNKYLLMYLKEVYEYLSENDRCIIDKVFNEEVNLKLQELECYEVLCGDVYSNVTLVDSFSSESDEKINNPETPKYVLKSIYSDRVKYFKKRGIYLGRNYDNYKNSLDCINVFPDSDIVDKIIELRSNLSKKERVEYLASTSLYKKYLEEINELNLFGYWNNSNYNDFVSGVTYLEPNLRLSEGNFSLYNLLVINSSLPDDYFDNSFLHECCHLNDTSIVHKGDGYCVIRCGFEEWVVIIDNDKYKENKEILDDDINIDFTFFDEIINELLAQDITKLLHDDGIYLFDNKEISKVGKGTSYERFKLLVEDFYIEFKEEIKYSRITGDMQFLYDLIGRDNFLELNSLINEFALYFDDDRYYDMLDDWYDGYETDDTLYFDECLKKAKNIFLKMKDNVSLCVINNISLGM